MILASFDTPGPFSDFSNGLGNVARKILNFGGNYLPTAERVEAKQNLTTTFEDTKIRHF